MKRRYLSTVTAALAFALTPLVAVAQTASPTQATAAGEVARPQSASRLTLTPYLAQVAQGNLEIGAQRSNLTIAEAQIAVARVFPDPVVSAGLLQYDVTKQGNPTASIVQLTVPLQIGGQRGARIDVAQSSLSAAQADLEDFLRTLRGSAANAYVDALHARLILERRRRTLESLEQLTAVNQERLRAGDIGEVVVLQSRVEASQFRAQVIDANGEVQAADLALVQFLGSSPKAQTKEPLALEGDLQKAAAVQLDPTALVAEALARRPDLIAARRRVTLAQRQVALSKSNRIVDVAVGGSWQHNFAVGTPGNLPSSDFVGATLAVPIPFSRLYRGELDAAYASQTQSEASSRVVALRVEIEVRQAIARYDAAAARVRLYTGGVLADADSVLEKTLFNYRRGGATLVEVLIAQRTDNDVYLSYFEALADAGHALIGVQQATAGWNVPL